MSPQELFDTVATHLLTQRKPAMARDAGGSETCCYRTEDGRKCAAGCLIPDDVDVRTFNDLPWYQVPQELKVKLGLVDLGKEIHELQKIHDDPINWKCGVISRLLKEFTQTFRLSDAVLDQYPTL